MLGFRSGFKESFSGPGFLENTTIADLQGQDLRIKRSWVRIPPGSLDRRFRNEPPILLFSTAPAIHYRRIVKQPCLPDLTCSDVISFIFTTFYVLKQFKNGSKQFRQKSQIALGAACLSAGHFVNKPWVQPARERELRTQVLSP